jgi:hypothetical protein
MELLSQVHLFVNRTAYTNNFVGATDYLVRGRFSNRYVIPSKPPNDGVLVAVGNLGVNVDADSGFDIGGNECDCLCFEINNATVYTINLTTGAATKVSDVNIQNYCNGGWTGFLDQTIFFELVKNDFLTEVVFFVINHTNYGTNL